MFSSGNEVGTLAVWVGEGGRVGGWLGLRGRAPRGVGGSEAGPLSTTTTTSFFDRDGSTAVCPPPPPPERGSPVDDVDAAERTRKTGRGVADGAEMLVQISILRMSTNLNTTLFGIVPFTCPDLDGAFPKHFSQPRMDARTSTTTTPCCWSSGKRML